MKEEKDARKKVENAHVFESLGDTVVRRAEPVA
jgi:hypothetical protein